MRCRSFQVYYFSLRDPGRPAVSSLSLGRDFLLGDLSLERFPWCRRCARIRSSHSGTRSVPEYPFQTDQCFIYSFLWIFWIPRLIQVHSDLVSPRVPALRYRSSGRYCFTFSGPGSGPEFFWPFLLRGACLYGRLDSAELPPFYLRGAPLSEQWYLMHI